MIDDAVSISLSDEERLFVDSQIAAGKYADDSEILHAGLAALERQQRLKALRELIAEGDAGFERGDIVSFDATGEISEHVIGQARLRRELAEAEASGESHREIPEIMSAVKTKLRANGAL